MEHSEFRIAIVGAGPMCVYALERLAAHALAERRPGRLRLSIFERSGRFGAGEVHSDLQPFTSVMNRIVAQIALGADESNEDAAVGLPAGQRVDFQQWLARARRMGGPEYQLHPRDVPQRRVHGRALRAAFEHYVGLLVRGGAEVDRHACEVVDVESDRDTYHVHAADGTVVVADHVLFVTGHTAVTPQPGSFAARAMRSNDAHRPGYIANPYPLDDCCDAIAPGSTVAIQGLGLTAIDVMLFLTEGRGGSFVPERDCDGRRLVYVPSGREPRRIVGFSPSGMFTSARPDNYKSEVPGSEHQARFFTVEAVRALRGTHGSSCTLSARRQQRQLDFTKHVFPLVVLEMAFVYYRTLLGERFGEHIAAHVAACHQKFLHGGVDAEVEPIDFLLTPVHRCFEGASAYIDAVRRDAASESSSGVYADMGVLQGFCATLFGGPGSRYEPRLESCREDLRTRVSPWAHSSAVQDHRFRWQSVLEPLEAVAVATPEQWSKRVIEFMRVDHLRAEQGNLANPHKAACDGVWRDLRGVLCEVLDFGGLTSHSHREYLSRYHRYYNRLSNGAGLASMRKVLALVEAGVVDVSTGPASAVGWARLAQGFEVRGSLTRAKVQADVLIEGRVPAFDAARDAGALYPNLLRRGLVCRFRNPGREAGTDFYPGGLDLSDRFHPIRPDGTTDCGLTFLGAPAEGIRSFLASAARPASNNSILNGLARWAEEVWSARYTRERFLWRKNA